MSTRYDPERHHRRSIRLDGYDYRGGGGYFITIVTQDRGCVFGDVVNGAMRLNAAGQMAQTVWNELPAYYSGVDIDAFVIMPNHIHGIAVVAPAVGVGAAPCGRPDPCRRPAPDDDGQPHAIDHPLPPGPPQGVACREGQPQGVAPTLSLADVVHRYKTMTTKRYVDGVRQSGWAPFPGRLWQRNYYEHIIRNEESMRRFRQYILDNPARWPDDAENPRARR
jgi:REP element-mobilizing transposase RayT